MNFFTWPFKLYFALPYNKWQWCYKTLQEIEKMKHRKENKNIVFPFMNDRVKCDYLKGHVKEIAIDEWRRRPAHIQNQTNLKSDHILLPHICLGVFLKETKIYSLFFVLAVS